MKHSNSFFDGNAGKGEPFEGGRGDGGNILPACHCLRQVSFGLAKTPERGASVKLTREQGDGERVKVAVSVSDKSGNLFDERLHRPRLYRAGIIAAMPRPIDARKTELMLLVLTLFVVLCGFALVFLGKSATTPLPRNVVNVNTATARQLAQSLSVSPAVAAQVVKKREGQKGGRFAAVDAVRRALRGTTSRPVGDVFVARTPAEVARGFWGGVLLFLVAFAAAHALLRKAAPRADPFVLPIVALLSGLGLMMVYSVKDPYRDTFAFTGQAFNLAVFGLIAFALPQTRIFARLTLRRYQYAYALAAVGLTLLLLVAGHGPGGVHIQLFGFEPVEIIKLLLVFFVVSYLSERRGVATRWQDVAPLLVIYAFALFLFVLVKDLGPAVLLFGTFVTLLFLATQRAVFPLAGTLLLLAAAWVGFHFHIGLFATRVTMWLHPWANGDGRGGQLAQGLWGMATGGIGGSGLGLGQPEVMPRAGSDLIFATVGEELGLVGTAAVLAAAAILLTRGFVIAREAQTDFDRLLAAGLTTLLALQTMIIVGGVTGIVPLTGITLPFVSFGGSSLTANFFLVGVLLHLSGKRLPEGAADPATPNWNRAAKLVTAGGAAFLLLIVGGKLIWVQALTNRATATRPLRTPDADKIIRPHVNPRLLSYAAAIPRGRILDRNGVVLARDAAPNETGGTGLLVGDGRRRIYPQGAACAQLLVAVEGANGPNNALGQNGTLRGFGDYASLLKYYRRTIPAHLHGEDVTLTLDSELQQAALDALRRHAPKGRGAAVVLDVASGDVLAAPSLPTFDPNTLTPARWSALLAGANGQTALLNRAVNGLYPPGSTFKIVTAASAMAHGLDAQTYACRHTATNVRWRFGDKTYARRRITDEEGFVSHGPTDLAKAIRVSCNVYFAHLGISLGADALDQTAREAFGLRHLPSLGKLGEDLPDCAYGQGAVLATPLEMAQVAATVANDGTPLLVQFLLENPRSTGIASGAIPPEQARRLQEMLAAVTTDGTARGVFDGLHVSVAGKTGSAQNNQGDHVSHSWFVGFAPAVRPTLAFACIVENGGFGRSAAAPVCREIVRRVL